MFIIQTENYTLRPALLVINIQNGFVSKGGSYDKLGMDTSNYRAVVPKIRELINLCREMKIPIFYIETIRVAVEVEIEIFCLPVQIDSPYIATNTNFLINKMCARVSLRLHFIIAANNEVKFN
jgi:hypothetical protein